MNLVKLKINRADIRLMVIEKQIDMPNWTFTDGLNTKIKLSDSYQISLRLTAVEYDPETGAYTLSSVWPLKYEDLQVDTSVADFAETIKHNGWQVELIEAKKPLKLKTDAPESVKKDIAQTDVFTPPSIRTYAMYWALNVMLFYVFRYFLGLPGSDISFISVLVTAAFVNSVLFVLEYLRKKRKFNKNHEDVLDEKAGDTQLHILGSPGKD